MKKNNVIKNYLYNLSYQILAIVIPLITTPYLSRVLGAENIGIYSYTLSITTYFILFGSLGVAMYGQREIAYFQDNIEKRSKTFWEIFIMRGITLAFSTIIFYFSFCIRGQYQVYYKILILEIFANFIDISWYFQGLEEFKKTVLRNMLVKLISVILVFILVKKANDLNKYFLIYVFSNVIGNLSLWIYLPKFIRKIKILDLQILKHVKPTIMLFIPQIAIQIYTILDKTMIGIIVSDKSEVGYYEQAQKMIKLLLTIATSFGMVMMPRVAATFAKGNNKQVQEYMNKSISFISLITFPLMFGIISISYKFVPIFYGNGYEKVAPLLCIISPIIIFIGFSSIIGNQYLLPTKQQGKYTFSVIIGAIVNFILNLILIKLLKSFGASIATVIAEFVVTFTQFVLVRKEISIFNVIKSIYKYIIASIIMFMISICLGYFIKNNLISIIVQVISSILVYLVVILLVKDKMVFEGINMIKNKFLKVKEK